MIIYQAHHISGNKAGEQRGKKWGNDNIPEPPYFRKPNWREGDRATIIYQDCHTSGNKAGMQRDKMGQ